MLKIRVFFLQIQLASSQLTSAKTDFYKSFVLEWKYFLPIHPFENENRFHYLAVTRIDRTIIDQFLYLLYVISATNAPSSIKVE